MRRAGLWYIMTIGKPSSHRYLVSLVLKAELLHVFTALSVVSPSAAC